MEKFGWILGEYWRDIWGDIWGGYPNSALRFMPPTLFKASSFRVFSSGLARTMYGAWLVQYGQSQVNYLPFQILEVAARAKSRTQCMAVQLYKKLAFYTMRGTSKTM